MSKQQIKTRRQTAATKKSTVQANEACTNQRQSVEIVQTLILTSLSCVGFTRALFPDKAFEPRVFDKANVLSFDTSANSSGIQGDDKARWGTRVQVLHKGRSGAVDRFLDWLDGVYDALKQNVLRCLQLNVFEDEQTPQNVIETWTFTFAYASKAHQSTGIASMDIKCPNGSTVTYANATWALQNIVRQIIGYCGTLPQLPDTRFISLHIFFTDDCDPNYQPPGFMESSQSNAMMKFPKNSNYDVCSKKFSSLDSGYHSVTLKVDHLSSTAESFAENIPESLVSSDYVVSKIRADDIDTEMVEAYESSSTVRSDGMSNTNAQSQDPTEPKESDQAPTGVRLVEDSLRSDTHVGNADTVEPVTSGDDFAIEDVDLDDSINSALPAPISQNPLAATTSETSQIHQDSLGATTSQQQKDRTVKFRLEQMLKPITHETQSGETQLRPPDKEESPRKPISKPIPQRVELSQWTIRNMPHPKPQAQWATQSDVIKCPCGRQEENSDFMVCCEFCNTWQHVECYGFLDGNDYQDRMVEPFACYECMLQGKEMPLLRELQHLALLRKGAFVLKNHGYTTDNQLAKHLRCDLLIARDVANHFIHYGYLRREEQTKKSKAPRRKFVVATGDVFQKMKEEYFDPTAKIRHHLKLDTETDVPSTKILPRKDTVPVVPFRPSSNKQDESKIKSTAIRSARTNEKILSGRSSNPSTKVAPPDHAMEPRTPAKQKRSAEHSEGFESTRLPSRKKQFRGAVTVKPIGMKGWDSPVSLK